MGQISERIERLPLLKKALLVIEELRLKLAEANPASREPIAIVGIGCRFPAANNPVEFWQMLANSVDAITEVPPERWDIDYYYDQSGAAGKMDTRWGGFLTEVDKFDPYFFGISPREAINMDPQQRLLLEVAWESLENAYIPVDRLAGSQTGVFIGISNVDYFWLQSEPEKQLNSYSATGNSHSIIANRISYLFGFKGPSISIDTACSSSLVSIHMACQSLRNRECNLALAGGVNLILSPLSTIAVSKILKMATDGRCKTFDIRADGIVRGEGCGLVVLKRLSDAISDQDNILAVIRGSAVNQDGRSAGLTAPNGLSQQQVIRAALAQAKIDASKITFIEAHGTATPLGDPIEVESLAAIYGRTGEGLPRCAISSVKTNIGHLESAAGVAGLIKTVLSLQHRKIVPHLHFTELNRNISLDQTGFFIPTELSSWDSEEKRYAAVSSFGFGGTNAHMVLEEPPQQLASNKATVDRPLHIFTLSAKSEIALQSLVEQYLKILPAEVAIADLCYSANTTRSQLPLRLALVSESTEQLKKELTNFSLQHSTAKLTSGWIRKRSKTAFLFAGQGAQYPAMGRQLYETLPTFRKSLDQCDEISQPLLGRSIVSLLYSESDSLLNETIYTQPVLFAFQYSLAQVWHSWGVEPDAMLGHSLGEYVAACLAGVFSLADGLKLVFERGQLMQTLAQKGMMAAVFADQETVFDTIIPFGSNISIAAINGPANIVISGLAEDIQTISKELQGRGIVVKILNVSQPFHSFLMQPILNQFEQLASKIPFHIPNIAMVSNLTGKLLDVLPDASYWRQHLREPVQFYLGMQSLAEYGCETFIEISPHTVLIGMGRHCLPEQDFDWLPSLKKDNNDWEILLSSLSHLYTKRLNIDWLGFDRDYQRKRVSLPNYQWERERYWIAPTATSLPKEQLPLLWQRMLCAGAEQSQDCPLEFALHNYVTKSSLIEDLVIGYITTTLNYLRGFREKDDSFSLETLISQCGIIPGYRKLLTQWLERLVEAGWLSLEGEIYTVVGTTAPVSIENCWRRVAQQWQQNSYEFTFLKRCGENLVGVLRGKINPLDLLFPEASFELAEGIYQHLPENRYFNRIIRAVLEPILISSHRDLKLNILEVGAGVGATTTQLLSLFCAERATYTFTDVSELFLARAREKFISFPFISYALFDIERDPATQGLELYNYDVVIASNVLHATADLEKTLDYIRSLLKPAGTLIILEATSSQPWLEITFGLFSGWHKYSDSLRQYGPLLSKDRWISALKEHGFDEAVAFPPTGIATEMLGQHVIVARASSLGAPIDQSTIMVEELKEKTIFSSTMANNSEESFRLTELVATQSSLPMQQLENYIKQQLSKVMNIPIAKLAMDLPMESLGMDSLMAVELRNQLKANLNVEGIPLEDIPRMTIYEISLMVNDKLSSVSQPITNQSSSYYLSESSLVSSKIPSWVDDSEQVSPDLSDFQGWFFCPWPNPSARVRLFCFHHAGGGASIFHSWPSGLPLTVELYGVQLPGRENRLKEPPITKLGLLLEELSKAITPLLTMPFIFFGHSMGALISFELARKLRKQKQAGPSHLFVSSRCAPQTIDINPPIHMLADEEFVKALRRYGGIPAEILQEPKLLANYLPTLRADFTILENYVYKTEEKLHCPISVWGGSDDKTVKYEDLYTWCDQTDGPFNIEMLTGGHFFLAQQREIILSILTRQIQQLIEVEAST
ncbi:MAG: beta-ketoacyl synthase N-terminal-like domain-containing protein [Acidobacteriota bacterium]